jgi:hypothetical protein
VLLVVRMAVQGWRLLQQRHLLLWLLHVMESSQQ